MRKIIAAINMSIDGFCDHTLMSADDALHEHYSDLLRDAGLLLYGRKTFELMEYWRTLVENPSGEKANDEFALVMDKTPKLVFSKTLKDEGQGVNGWKSARLAKAGLKDEVRELRQQSGKDIFVGSRSLIVGLLNEGLIDEFQLCVLPVIAGKGLPLLDKIHGRIELKLIRTKVFESSGSIVLYYQPGKMILQPPV